jgi:hypothetical protein
MQIYLYSGASLIYKCSCLRYATIKFIKNYNLKILLLQILKVRIGGFFLFDHTKLAFFG